jgi:multisubunit Na+/H+ antiporter MnhG subunit
VTTIGVPLLSVGLCVESGNAWIIAEVLLIMAMLAVAGPMLEAATARAAAQRRGLIGSEQPE